MDPITVAKLWMVVKPIKRIKEARQRRRAKRMAETMVLTTQAGETITRTEPLIPARTSTKALVGSAIGAYPGYQVVQMIQDAMLPWPWLEDFTNGPGFVWLCATIIPLVIARFTKSPLGKAVI